MLPLRNVGFFFNPILGPLELVLKDAALFAFALCRAMALGGGGRAGFALELEPEFGFGGRCSLGAAGATVGEPGGFRLFRRSAGAECRLGNWETRVGEGDLEKERGLGMGRGLFGLWKERGLGTGRGLS